MCEYTNSKQAQFTKSSVSCGLVEVHHLPDNEPGKTVFAIANYLYHKANPRPAAFILFSDVVNPTTPSRGQRLSEFLSPGAGHGLGDLQSSGREVNPRTGNTIQVWLFTPDHDAFRRWYTDQVMHRLDTE
jgi:hypothetical protein